MFPKLLQFLPVLSILLAPVLPLLPASARIPAERCGYYLGDSALGVPISVDLRSVAVVDEDIRDFIYCLGTGETYEAIGAEANCDYMWWTAFWSDTTQHGPQFDDVTVEVMTRHVAQSDPTTDMLTLVCSAPDSMQPGSDLPAVVEEPPVIVRTAPHSTAPELCTLDRFTAIGVRTHTTRYVWMRTDGCGRTAGFVHTDDLRFFRPVP